MYGFTLPNNPQDKFQISLANNTMAELTWDGVNGRSMPALCQWELNREFKRPGPRGHLLPLIREKIGMLRKCILGRRGDGEEGA
jgi:hypothetical protein